MASFTYRFWCAWTAAVVCFFAITPAYAVADVAPADLEAAVRTLGFLDSLPRHSPVTISVVYKAGDAESKAQGQRAAAILAGLPGPNSSTIVSNVVSTSDLGQGARKVDVIYVLPGVSDNSRAVTDFTHRQRVLSISNDPACLNAQCCALVVRAGARTEIVLDTNAARETGATFSSFFMMMVKRR